MDEENTQGPGSDTRSTLPMSGGFRVCGFGLPEDGPGLGFG